MKRSCGRRRGPPLATVYRAALVCGFLALAAPLGCQKHSGGSHDRAHDVQVTTAADYAIPVRIAHPAAGGLPRLTTQPASIISFQSADLYSKVSGYLKNQVVDIGDTVRKGQELAQIDAPELIQEVERCRAELDRARSEVTLSTARLKNAQAQLGAAAARGGEVEAKQKAAQAEAALRDKQLQRMRELASLKAVEAELVDEAQAKMATAQSDLVVAERAVLASQSDTQAAQASVEHATAAVADARVGVKVAEANLAKAQVFENYTHITSPYDGVITERNFFDGDFIRSADQKNQVPILSVHRTDRMRAVALVPDRDVPWVHRDDPALLKLDELADRSFKGAVARTARHEDPATRLMRCEVDLPNPKGILQDGMYGQLTILLERHPKGVTLPSQCLTGSAKGSERAVYVVRDGRAREVRVRVDRDTGAVASIGSGLSPDDSVVAVHTAALKDGATVRVLGEMDWQNPAAAEIAWANQADGTPAVADRDSRSETGKTAAADSRAARQGSAERELAPPAEQRARRSPDSGPLSPVVADEEVDR